MNSNRLFLTLSLLLQVCFMASCEKDLSPLLGLKDARKLAWTVDTLTYQGNRQTWLRSIWGTSPNNVYVVGHSGAPAGRMFRYNGNKWSTTGYHASEGGTISGQVFLSDIFGFSTKDVWCCGDRNFKSFIMHYNGLEWTEITGLEGKLMESVWGGSPNDVWFGGVNGTLFHWDGQTMRKDSLPIFIPQNADPVYNTFIVGNKLGLTYALLIARPQGVGREIYYIFRRNMNQWVLKDSISGVILYELWVSQEGIIYRNGDEIQFYENNAWHSLFSLPDLITGINGTSVNNIFIGGGSGFAFHYNGENWFQYKQLANPDVTYLDIWIGEREVFYLGRLFDSVGRTIVYHGK